MTSSNSPWQGMVCMDLIADLKFSTNVQIDRAYGDRA
jgi:hypothetical protein